MTRSPRLPLLILALTLASGVLASVPTATAETPPPHLLDAAEAVAQAMATGEPVVASALTDERTLVTADPETGLLQAKLSAQVSRVPDGRGGWREPSAQLVAAGNSTWVAEAATVPITVVGGDGVFLTMGEGDFKVAFQWPEALPSPTIDGNLATFAEVVPGVDLVVRTAIDGAETFLIVKDPSAAQHPLVRSVPITLAPPALQSLPTESGGIAYLDEAGDERVIIPPAYLWDATGQPVDASLADLLDPPEGAQIEPLAVEDGGILRRGTASQVSFEVSEEAAALLDDPTTVFPVVIDPSVSMEQSYAVRVTQDFTKYNSDIGSRGKIGYNGWSSPYYKSRMYYQFRWPKNNKGAGTLISASQITMAEFSYVQTHSPQHSCSDTDFGPSVKVQFHNTINSGTTWSDQPGTHSDSGSKTNDYAVGHEDVCKKTYTQKWNITSGVQRERTDYETRTTVTLGIRSSDESDKNGWREYKHSSSSPDLLVTYEPEPPTPTGFSITNTNSVPGQPLVTTSSSVRMQAKVALASGFQCRLSTDCLQARFKVSRDRAVLKEGDSNRVVPNSPTLPFLDLSGLVEGTYDVEIRSYNRDTKLLSLEPAAYTFTVDLPPAAPIWSWAIENWPNQNTVPSNTPLPIALSNAPNDAKVCVKVGGVAIDLDPISSDTCVKPDKGKITIPGFERFTSTTVELAYRDHSESKWTKKDVAAV
ncbi:MAG: hypothetical protein QM804_13105 [Propionicimonas sp.]